MGEAPEGQQNIVQTQGGSVVEGDVHAGGDFVGRDKVTIGAQIFNFLRGDTEEGRQLRNRQAMLALVRDTWVRGVLEQSLYGVAVLALGLETQPGAVAQPWEMTVEMPAQAPRRFEAGTTITQVFAEAQGSLLILGEPGAGKTTMLLELARELIGRAELDPVAPMPVVFNLSSWAEKRPPLVDWLVEELNSKYSIPKKLARGWVEGDALLPLLDGLDEVKADYRNDCVKAINDFRQEHLVGLAICCRAEEHKALAAQLKLAGAVRLLPLTGAQVDAYLASAGEKLAVVRAVLRDDGVLQEMMESPLLLNVMALAYQDKAVGEIRLAGSLAERRGHLWDAYIERMFGRPGRSRGGGYSRERTVKWLAWLAANMVQRQQTILLVERLQPDWLQVRSRIWLYRLICTLCSGWTVGLMFGLLGGLMEGLGSGLAIVLIFGLMGALIGGILCAQLDISPTERLVFARGMNRGGLGVGLFLGLGFGLIFGLIGALIGALTIGLLFGLFRAADIPNHTHPNQGIKKSAVSAVVAGLSSWLVSGLAFWLIARLEPLGNGSSAGEGGLVFGFMISLLFGGLYGGIACIQHIVLRTILWLFKLTPLNYPRFLDYCAERIFLRKVGGGYIFIHRLLMEHFASLTAEDIQRLAGTE